MAYLKGTVVWLVFLLAHLDVELVQSFPSLSFTIKKCPPSPTDGCLQSQKDLCQNDQDCEVRYPGKEFKCCDDCGKNCLASEVQIVKVTPAKYQRLKPRNRLVAKCITSPPSIYSPPGPDQECQNDAVCDDKYPGQDLKCCSDGDDFRCMAPVVEALLPAPDPASGRCPVFPDPAECPDQYDHDCYSNEECAELYPGQGLKCCREGCYFTCHQPIFNGQPPQRSYVNGTCPVFQEPPICPDPPVNECIDDAHCRRLHPGFGLICCTNTCEFKCVIPMLPLPT